LLLCKRRERTFADERIPVANLFDRRIGSTLENHERSHHEGEIEGGYPLPQPRRRGERRGGCVRGFETIQIASLGEEFIGPQFGAYFIQRAVALRRLAGSDDAC